MAKHQFIVAYLILFGIAAVYSQYHEDAQLRPDGKSVFYRQDWPKEVIRRVRRFTPHERSDMAGAFQLDREVHKNLRVLSAALRAIRPPMRVNQRQEDHQRHVDRIEQERLHRLRERQQAEEHRRHMDRIEQERQHRLRERQRQQAEMRDSRRRNMRQ